MISWGVGLAIVIVLGVILILRYVGVSRLARAPYQISMQPRLALAAVAGSTIAAILIWFALDRFVLSQVDNRWAKYLNQRQIAGTAAWLGFEEDARRSAQTLVSQIGMWGSRNNSDEEEVDSYIENESDTDWANTGMRGEVDFLTRLFGSARRAGLDVIYYDRRTTVGRYVYSPGIPGPCRERLLQAISITLQAQPTHSCLVPDRQTRGLIILPGNEGSPTEAFIYLGTTTVPGWKNVAIVKRIRRAPLDTIREQIGHDIILRFRGMTIASTLETGEPVVDFPFHNLDDVRFLIHHMEVPQELTSSGVLKMQSLVCRMVQKEIIGPQTVQTLMASSYRYAACEGDTETSYGYFNNLVKYTRINMPIPRDPTRAPMVTMPIGVIERELSTRLLPMDNVKPEWSKFVKNLIDLTLRSYPEAYYPESGGSPAGAADYMTRRAEYWRVGSDMPRLRFEEVGPYLADRLDWRPMVPVTPLNLWTASPADIKRLLTQLSLAQYQDAIDYLERHIGPQAENIVLEDFIQKSSLPRRDAGMLMGFMYRQDPRDWEQNLRVVQNQIPENGQVTIAGRAYNVIKVSLGGYIGAFDGMPQSRVVNIELLVDRTPLINEKRTLWYVMVVSVTTVFFLTIVIFHLIGVTITRPLARLKDAVTAIGTGDLNQQLEPIGRDEMAVVSKEFNRMVEGLREKQRMRGIFETYVSGELVETVLRGDDPTGFVPAARTDITVLFSDLRGFTSWSTRTDPQEVMATLNVLFPRLIDAVQAEGGVVDKLIGDALMVHFGTPLKPLTDDAKCAVRAAIAMQREADKFNTERVANGLPRLDMGIGLAHGAVVAGSVGSASRKEYTVIGNEVNLASRLCSKAAPREIVISEWVRIRLDNSFVVEELERLMVKGIDIPVRAFRVCWNAYRAV